MDAEVVAVVEEALPLALSEDAQQSRLFINNSTDQAVLIKFTNNSKLLQRIVREKSSLYICSPLLLSSIKVFPHGKYKGKANIESMTAGIAQQPDKSGEILSCIIKEKKVDVYLNILLPKGISSVFSSFGYEIQSQRTDTLQALPATLEEVFPYIKILVASSKGILSTFTSSEKISPRHFLSVPEEASEDSIEYAYHAMKSLWQNQKNDLGKQVNNFLDKSYEILIQQIRLKEKEAALDQLTHQFF